jgi:low affinity Fe/Cu permease
MKKKKTIFERLAHCATVFSGSTLAFMVALLVIFLWIVTGPYFKFSDTWQLVINTSTTVITFLMVFLIQRAQNKDSRAIHLKLNELVASMKGSSNRLIDIENLTEEELQILSGYYITLAEIAKKDKKLSVSHSIEEVVEEQVIEY